MTLVGHGGGAGSPGLSQAIQTKPLRSLAARPPDPWAWAGMVEVYDPAAVDPDAQRDHRSAGGRRRTAALQMELKANPSVASQVRTPAEAMGRGGDGRCWALAHVEHGVGVRINPQRGRGVRNRLMNEFNALVRRAGKVRRAAGYVLGDDRHSDVDADARGATGWKRKARKLLCRALPTGPARRL